MDKVNQYQNIALRLTYFWIFTEAGLGGVLHLYHIPLTGFIIGGFSLIINVLLAKYTNYDRSLMLKTLGLVLVAKFALSPYSPIGAYIAVAFQGLLAVLLFPVFGTNRVVILIYAILIMLENAIQKPLMAYLIYGNVFYEGVLKIAHNLLKFNDLAIEFIVGLYFSLYVLWGGVVAFWASGFSEQLAHFSLDESQLALNDFSETENKKINKKWHKSLIVILLCLSVACLVIFDESQDIALYVLKTLALLFLFSFVLPFLFRKMQGYFVLKNQHFIAEVSAVLPTIRARTMLAYQLSKEKKGLGKIQYFIFLCLYLNVFAEKSTTGFSQ
jgi:hypothetical protein